MSFFFKSTLFCFISEYLVWRLGIYSRISLHKHFLLWKNRMKLSQFKKMYILFILSRSSLTSPSFLPLPLSSPPLSLHTPPSSDCLCEVIIVEIKGRRSSCEILLPSIGKKSWYPGTGNKISTDDCLKCLCPCMIQICR